VTRTSGAARSSALLITIAWVHAAAAQVVTIGASSSHAKTAAHLNEAPPGYRIGPTPTWVVAAKEPQTATVEPAPMHYRVIDEQTRLLGKSETNYLHVVRVIDEAAGLEGAAHIEIDFDPSYQKLTLHHLELVREGQRSSRLGKRYPLLRRETQLEKQMYDGRQTLSIVVDDVRVGDEIDYDYSLAGSNPVFGDKFVRTLWMRNVRGPEALHQVRLLAPLARDIHYRNPDKAMRVTTRMLGDFRELLFRREAVPRLSVDPQAPYNSLLAEQLQFSEFTDWSEVARWGSVLFASAPGGELLAQQIAAIRSHAGTREAQLLAALDFVQKEVRYFGTEIGASTHRPASPEQVLRQRFGDCKDKVALLLALLDGLDIKATPVLVSLALRSAAAELLPSPLDFDHVIARVELDGSTYWLDATRAHQTGTLEMRQLLGLGQGLPLKLDATALVPLRAVYDTERLVARDTIRFETFAADPSLESRLTFRGDLAEGVREALTQQSLNDLAGRLSAPYLRTYPKARTSAPLQVENATEDDSVTLVQHFVIPEFWRLPEQQTGTDLSAQLVPYALVDALTLPRSETRRQALAFAYPGVFRHFIVVEYPADVYTQPPASRYEDGDEFLTLTERVQGTARRIEFASELRINADEVPAAAWPAFTAKLSEWQQKLGFVVSIPAVSPGQLNALARELKSVGAKRAHDPQHPDDPLVQARLLVLAAEIDGGRLPPQLEARVRAERGKLYDRQGYPERAGADFSRALELAPLSAEALSGAAANALRLQQLDRAIELATRALQQSAHDELALETRARALYLSKNLPGARADLEQALKDSAAVTRGYSLVWLGFTLRQSAQDVSAATASYASAGIPTEWPRPLIELAAGRADAEAVLSAARARRDAASLCQAYFYIGEDYYTRGKLDEARKSWEKATAQGAAGAIEDGTARLRLRNASAK
jgi:lipoprotein NlpI/transglutaminase-like putative cysteine protease